MGWRITRQVSRLPLISTFLRMPSNVVDSSPSRIPWIVAALSLVLFAGTMYRDLTWHNYGGDGGELITASMTMGVAHPPGYPLYIIVGRIFGALPVGNIASRYNLLSAVAGAAAIGLTAQCLILVSGKSARTRGRIVAVSLALAFTPLLWSQALIAEVYAVFLFLVAFFIWTLVSDRSPLTVGIAFGLAISGHLTGIMLLPLALWKTARSGLSRFVLGMAVGLVPYTFLPLIARSDGPVIWGDLGRVGGWWWLVTAQLYRPNSFGLPASLWAERLASWFNPTILIPLLIWLALAIWNTLKTRGSSDRLQIVLVTTALLYVAFAFTYRPPDSAVLLLPAFLLASVVVGRGLRAQRNVAVWLLPLAMLFLALASFPGREPDTLRQDTRRLLNQVPDKAIVMTSGDATIAALSYYHHVEGIRPDIIVFDQNMFQFHWYRDKLRRDHPTLWVPMDDALGRMIVVNQSQRPICQMSLLDEEGIRCSLPQAEAFNG